MEVLASRILLRPPDPERTREFYEHAVGLHRFREFGVGQAGGVVYFLGGGFLEISGRGSDDPSDATQIWLQVRSADEAHTRLERAGAVIVEAPAEKPWGLIEMRARDPDGRLLIFVEVPPDHPMRRDVRAP